NRRDRTSVLPVPASPISRSGPERCWIARSWGSARASMVQRYRVAAVHRMSSMDVFSADWPGICRRIVEEQEKLFELTPSREARTEYEGVGKGGDRSLVIDRRCEDVVFAELEQLAGAGASFIAISEE